MNKKELKLECIKIGMSLALNTYDLIIAKAEELYVFCLNRSINVRNRCK